MNGREGCSGMLHDVIMQMVYYMKLGGTNSLNLVRQTLSLPPTSDVFLHDLVIIDDRRQRKWRWLATQNPAKLVYQGSITTAQFDMDSSWLWVSPGRSSWKPARTSNFMLQVSTSSWQLFFAQSHPRSWAIFFLLTDRIHKFRLHFTQVWKRKFFLPCWQCLIPRLKNRI